MPEKRRRVGKNQQAVACLACCFRRAQSDKTTTASTQTASTPTASIAAPDVMVQERTVAFGALHEQEDHRDLWFEWEPLRRAFFPRETFPAVGDHVVIALRDVEEVCATQNMEEGWSAWHHLLDVLRARDVVREDVTIDRVVTTADGRRRVRTRRTLCLRMRFEPRQHPPPRHHLLDLHRFFDEETC